MHIKESETVELKRTIVDDIKKSVIAFANGKGGTLYIGVSDNGNVEGLSDPDADLLSINNMLRDGIKPDITLFTRSNIVQLEGKSVIIIEVLSGTECPYYMSGKGIRPEGVYVRQGAASVPASLTAIRKMIRETDGESYEKLRSMEQELDFTSASLEFARRSVPFGLSQMITLGLLNTNKTYTNLALLCSEQCVHTIKAALFQDTTQQLFQDRQEFSGSLFTQLERTYHYLDMNNKTASTFEGLIRIDTRAYPEVALREALLNAIVHREYATSGSILVKIFSNRIEFISPGGLVSGTELADIMSGYSACRNPNLAAIFYRLQLIEAYGTGILRIFEAYAGVRTQPEIEVTPNVFKITLPRIGNQPLMNRAPSAEDAVMHYLYQHGSINRKQAEQLLNLSQTAAGNVLRKLTEQGCMVREGNSRNIYYVPGKK